MDHDCWNDGTPATRCATDIVPVAASLSNAPPTATPSSAMSPFVDRLSGTKGGLVS